VIAAVILVVATNAALIAVSRLTFSMGHYRQLPDRLRQLHPRFKTPYIAIVAFAGIAALTMIPGQAEFLATLYAFGAMLSFTVAHIAVLRLRQRHPDRPRGWKPPLNVRLGGVEYPVTALLGGLGTFGAWVVVMALNLRTLVVGIAWMLVGAIVYYAYRKRCDLPIAQMVKVVTPEPLGVEEVEYRSVLLVFERGAYTEEAVTMAVRLAARRRRGIHVIAIVTLPTHLPLDAPLEEEESEAQSKIERAKLIGGLRVTGHTVRVRPGQEAHAIVEEAKAIDAAAIVMPLRYRNGKPLYGKTLQTVLAKRPTRVIVAAHPDTQQAVPA
jgi:basic amino acid/polyamine antiporter, APA family